MRRSSTTSRPPSASGRSTDGASRLRSVRGLRSDFLVRRRRELLTIYGPSRDRHVEGDEDDDESFDEKYRFTLPVLFPQGTK